MSQGLNFCKVDLHVHTPQSECFLDKSVTPAMIVDQAIKVGMKAIAITDHNSGDAVDGIKTAAKDKGLIVFPGVEINIQPGVHVLALFPEDKTSSNVNDLLQDLGLGTEKRGKNDSVVLRYGINEALSIIKKNGALPVLSHIDDISGAWKELIKTGQTFIQLWELGEFVAVEIVGDQLPEGIGKDPFYRIPAYYWASDSPHPDDPSKHSHLGIGSRYSLMKLPDPITWEGLRLCFQDPTTRIRHQKFSQSFHPIIESINIEGGFLNGFNTEVNSNLNCFIGGRGTGKSCFIETIRYAFDIPPKTDENKKTASNIVEHTFTPGSKITVRVKVDAESEYFITRCAREAPMVYRSGEDHPLDISPMNLLPIQVYGQKEIYEISHDPTFQLKLIDNFIEQDLDDLKSEEERILSDLRENASLILNLDDEIESLILEVSNLGTINEQIKRLEVHDLPAKLTLKNNYDRERELLEQAREKILELRDHINSFLEDNKIVLDGYEDEEIENLPNSDLLQIQKRTITEINDLLVKKFEEIQTEIIEKQGLYQEQITIWESDFEKQNTEYQTLLRKSQENGNGINPDQYINLQRQQRRLQNLSSVLIDKKRTRNRLISSRETLLESLKFSRRAQFELRQQKASELTRVLNNRVRITIWPQGNRNVFQSRLDAIFTGTRTRADALEKIVNTQAATPEREEQGPVPGDGGTRYLVPEIPSYLDQMDLAKAIQVENESSCEDESILLNTYGIASDAMRINISSISSDKLMDLQIIEIPDKPVIELKVGSGQLGYKPLDSLSIGQKCTVLLSLILLENPAPLLIDQPEDDLDNHFIFEQIVTTLRKEKEKRQFLIATHNANIPVSGDAELIMVLEADDQHGFISENGVGSIDSPTIKSHVEHILEGGKDAFLIRKEKYGI